jgi:hypothetical protein
MQGERKRCLGCIERNGTGREQDRRSVGQSKTVTLRYPEDDWMSEAPVILEKVIGASTRGEVLKGK